MAAAVVKLMACWIRRISRVRQRGTGKGGGVLEKRKMEAKMKPMFLKEGVGKIDKEIKPYLRCFLRETYKRKFIFYGL